LSRDQMAEVDRNRRAVVAGRVAAEGTSSAVALSSRESTLLRRTLPVDAKMTRRRRVAESEVEEPAEVAYETLSPCSEVRRRDAAVAAVAAAVAAVAKMKSTGTGEDATRRRRDRRGQRWLRVGTGGWNEWRRKARDGYIWKVTDRRLVRRVVSRTRLCLRE
jgi:hypothetical protein